MNGTPDFFRLCLVFVCARHFQIVTVPLLPQHFVVADISRLRYSPEVSGTGSLTFTVYILGNSEASS